MHVANNSDEILGINQLKSVIELGLFDGRLPMWVIQSHAYGEVLFTYPYEKHTTIKYKR